MSSTNELMAKETPSSSPAAGNPWMPWDEWQYKPAFYDGNQWMLMPYGDTAKQPGAPAPGPAVVTTTTTTPAPTTTTTEAPAPSQGGQSYHSFDPWQSPYNSHASFDPMAFFHPYPVDSNMSGGP